MSKKPLYFALVLVFCLASLMPAANIIWVSDWYDERVDGAPDDFAWIEFLEAHGYTVDNQPAASSGNGYWRTLDNNKIAALNAADLVIISKNSNSGDYANDATEIARWSGITAPLMLLSAHFTRSSRWQWINSTAMMEDGSTPTLEAVLPQHPIFNNVNLNVQNRVDVYDQSVGSGVVSFNSVTDVGNGILLAKPAGQDWTIIAEWEAGVPFYAATSQTPAGKRLFFTCGTREYVAGNFGRGEFNLTEEGKKIFLNAIEYMLGNLRRLKAYSPVPADGALYPDTWVSLSWSPGETAVSHDVYFGESFDDVNDGAGDTFRGSQTDIFMIVGFPGFAYPDGLVPGTTYYWRVDEVQADATTKHKGDVWRFTVPPNKAYDPSPPDGSRFVDPDIVLSWNPGWGAKFHTVYFDDDFDDVNNATAGLSQAGKTYDPVQLEIGKVYYWRVDEFDGSATYKGDVWSFRTIRPGGGIRGQYFRGTDLSGGPLVNRIDPEIDFDWADGSADPALPADGFSVRWTGEIELEFSETYTFYANTDDGVRLWVNEQLIIDRWVDRRAPTEAKGTISLTGGRQYPLVMEYYENTGNAVAQLSWESPSTPRQIVPQAALSLPVKASGPSPRNGAAGTRVTPVLTWNAGDSAASHDVYFGADADGVKNATKASPEYKGSKSLGDESYDAGKLVWDTSYYWRIDEVNNASPDSPWVGNVWTFTTGDFLVVDDFETYDIGNNEIWWSWKDGLGYGPHGNDPPYNGNGTGSAVGDESTSSYTEETIVHGGRQSMPLLYDNNKQGYAKYSEAELTLTATRDWTEEGVAELSLWFRGNPASVGSFTEAPAGTFTITATGVDIWNDADQFHFAYKVLTGAGTIEVQVLSVDNTDPWAKAGVMIRETLDAGSKFAAVYITPGNGCRFQARTDTDIAATSDTGVATSEQIAITAPYWVKIDRDFAGNIRCYYSSNGTTWTSMSWNPQNITMTSNVYMGLAVTSHNSGATCTARFSNFRTTGTVSGQWAHQDIGIDSNAAEPLYVAVSNSAGNPAIVVLDDPAAANINTWTEWVIPLQAFADQGINLTDVDRIAVGLGTKGNMTVPGGSGKMYFDDIRLNRPREAAE
jgi:hypothetical protein